MAETAVVTGASGFVATELCKQLLERGWHVRATVRNKADEAKTGHLLRLAQALSGHLELYTADLLRPGSFLSAVKGSHVVFHTASPFQIETADPQRDLVDPAVVGTRNVLSAVKVAKTVRRVILTSSVAAVHGGASASPPANGDVYTEADWNDTSTLENKEGYWVSKTSAERAAWKYAKEHSLDLITILPNFVLGPVITSRVDGLSAQFMQGWLSGKGGTDASTICDVRDVARAHILAAETPTASGRYIVSQEFSMSPSFVSETLKAKFAEYNIPEGPSVETKRQIDTSKAQKELGLVLTPLEQTLLDMARTALAVGIVKKSDQSAEEPPNKKPKS